MSPAFWSHPPGALLRLIGPLAPGRNAPKPGLPHAPVPVVCVGSLTRGGTGKTPAVIALAQRLVIRGRKVHVVTTGPGTPFQVDERGHNPNDVGDEPLLIAAFAPTWVAADPAEGVRKAAEAGAEVVVLDGGSTDRPVSNAVIIAVEDAQRGFGNGFAWPFGPLRRKLKGGLDGVDLLLTVGPPAAQTRFSETWGPHVPCPVLPAHLAPLPTGMDWEGLDVVAFAGIGAPERFFATLRGLGANLVRAQALSDHQEMTPALLGRLVTEAKRTGAQLVTTEKDAVRLPKSFRQNVLTLPVRLEPADWAPIDVLLP